MAFERMTQDLHNVARLDDEPNAVGGLSASELKDVFDKAPVELQDWLNNTLLPALEKSGADGGGAENIGIKAIGRAVGVWTVQAMLEWLAGQIVEMGQGMVPDGSIDETKLAEHSVGKDQLAEDLLAAANIMGLAAVATSGKYADLEGLPTLFTAEDAKKMLEDYIASAGFLTTVAAKDIADKTITLAKLASGVLAAANITGLAKVATSGAYTDLSGRPSIPTKVSQLANDSKYLTAVPDKSVTAAKLADAVKTLFAPAIGSGTSNPTSLATGKLYVVYE